MKAFRYHHLHFCQVNQLFPKLLGTSIQETFSSYFAKKTQNPNIFTQFAFCLDCANSEISGIAENLIKACPKELYSKWRGNCFQNWNSNYKRILRYLVSMRIFAFSMIICYSCWEHFYSCSLPSVSESKVKRREKNNYVKFINTVRSIFNGYTITISIKYILILEKPLQIKGRWSTYL